MEVCITLLYAIIRSGIFGKIIPPIKCFDNGDELHHYSNYIAPYSTSIDINNSYFQYLRLLVRPIPGLKPLVGSSFL